MSKINRNDGVPVIPPLPLEEPTSYGLNQKVNVCDEHNLKFKMVMGFSHRNSSLHTEGPRLHDPDPTIAICGECGLELKMVMECSCQNSRCPCGLYLCTMPGEVNDDNNSKI